MVYLGPFSVAKCFVLVKVVLSQNGLLTTVAYKLGPDQPTVYALEVSKVNFAE